MKPLKIDTKILKDKFIYLPNKTINSKIQFLFNKNSMLIVNIFGYQTLQQQLLHKILQYIITQILHQQNQKN